MKKTGICLVLFFLLGTLCFAQSIKGTGRVYTLNKATDFKYDLTKIEGRDYVIINGINIPDGFKTIQDTELQTFLLSFSKGARRDVELIDTLIVNVPEKIEGYTVGVIGGLGELHNIAVTSVTIPNTVVEIKGGSFALSSIKSFSFPNNLKILGPAAFVGSQLSGSITIPENITEISSNTFDFTKITEVIIHKGVNYIGRSAFENCSELVSVKLPAGTIKYVTYLTNGTHFKWKAGEEWFGYTLIKEIENNQWLCEDPNNNAFKNCPKLSLAVRNLIKESGYTGSF